MQAAERITLVAIFLLLIGGAGWLAYATLASDAPTAPTASLSESVIINSTSTPPRTEADWYPNPVTVSVNGQSFRASVADSLPERIQGLSGTPFLPLDMVKLFVFYANGPHSIWMKDMQYPLDIIWLNRERAVVHIETDISPETFPKSFSSPIPAWYVVEANVGFVASTSLAVGDVFTLPEGL